MSSLIGVAGSPEKNEKCLSEREETCKRPRILAFSGFVPEQICDTVRFFQYRGRTNISHYCGYAADFISQVLEDPTVDGAVFPRSCDSSRVMDSYLRESGKFLYRLHIPAQTGGAAVRYLAGCLREYKSALEERFGVLPEEPRDRAARINRRNAAIQKLYDSLPELSYSAYLEMLHRLLQLPLAEQCVPETLPAGAGGKPVYLVGSTVCRPELVSAIEGAGMKVAGDRLTESKRLFSAPPVEAGGDVFENIAASMLQNRTSPTQSDFAAILREDREEIERKDIKGVIFLTQKYCEPYDYLFSVYKKMLDEMSVPVLKLVLTDSTDGRRFDAAVEAFSDML